MIEPKKYLEHCQINAVFPKTNMLKYREFKCYPKRLSIGFDEHGDVTYSAVMEFIESNSQIQARLKENPLITIAEVRDLLNTSRKSAKPILEYMDSIKVTKKNGTESERVAYV